MDLSKTVEFKIVIL